METLRQAKENNTPFTFWLLPRRIPAVFREKVRESEAASSFRRPAFGPGFCSGSRIAEAGSPLYALNAQKSDCPQDGPGHGFGLRVARAIRPRRQTRTVEYFGHGDLDGAARNQGR